MELSDAGEYERIDSSGTSDFRTDVIFFFKDGSRLSNRRIERKIALSAKNVFGFYRGRVYPIERTVAHESLTVVDPFVEVTKATRRKFRYLDGGIRLAYNREECAKGVRYTVEYEIEYGSDVAYETMVLAEDRLMAAAIENGHFATTTEMSLENIFACVMTKVQMWHCFDARLPYLWAYKWDGVKAKLIVREDSDKAYLWRDADNINVVPFVGSRDFLKNLCLVVEILDYAIVIVEVVGSRFRDDRVYLSEPSTNIAMLDYLRDWMEHEMVENGGEAGVLVDGKPLLAQTFFESPMPRYQPNRDYDGFILVQNNTVIKWKMPTVDVRCVADNLYSVADKYLFELDYAGEKDAIYEISPDFKIVRKRNDRIVSSTEHEYSVFLESIKLLGRSASPSSPPSSSSSSLPSSSSPQSSLSSAS